MLACHDGVADVLVYSRPVDGLTRSSLGANFASMRRVQTPADDEIVVYRQLVSFGPVRANLKVDFILVVRKPVHDGLFQRLDVWITFRCCPYRVQCDVFKRCSASCFSHDACDQTSNLQGGVFIS
jgi:hypothetical protein